MAANKAVHPHDDDGTGDTRACTENARDTATPIPVHAGGLEANTGMINFFFLIYVHVLFFSLVLFIGYEGRFALIQM